MCVLLVSASACVLIVSTMPSEQTVVNMVAGNSRNSHSQGIARANPSVTHEDNSISNNFKNSERVATKENGTSMAIPAVVATADDSFESSRDISPPNLVTRNPRKSTPQSGVYKSDISNRSSNGFVSQSLVETELQTPARDGDFVEVVQEVHRPLAAELRALDSKSPLALEIAPALAQAEAAFAEVIASSGITDPSDSRYFDVWQRAARRSDDILRAWLGWDSFNALSVEARSAALASLGNPESK